MKTDEDDPSLLALFEVVATKPKVKKANQVKFDVDKMDEDDEAPESYLDTLLDSYENDRRQHGSLEKTVHEIQRDAAR